MKRSLPSRLMCLPLLTLGALAACAVAPADVGEDEAALSTTKTFLVPTTEVARTLCRAEHERSYCSHPSVVAAESKCASKLAAAGEKCVGCLRTETVAESCVADAPTYPKPAACTAPRMSNCTFYSACAGAAHSCGEQGYPLGYGERYCFAFKNNANFSSQGQRWRDDTMNCLQRALVSTLPQTKMACDAVTDYAFASHAGCYTQPQDSICDLPLADMLEVVHTINVKDLLSQRALAQEAAVAKTCVAHLVSKLFDAPTLPSNRAAVPAHQAMAEGEDLEAKLALWNARAQEIELSMSALPVQTAE